MLQECSYQTLINRHETGIAICQFFCGHVKPIQDYKTRKKKELEKERKYKTGCEVGSVYISAKAIHDYANVL